MMALCFGPVACGVQAMVTTFRSFCNSDAIDLLYEALKTTRFIFCIFVPIIRDPSLLCSVGLGIFFSLNFAVY